MYSSRGVFRNWIAHLNIKQPCHLLYNQACPQLLLGLGQVKPGAACHVSKTARSDIPPNNLINFEVCPVSATKPRGGRDFGGIHAGSRDSSPAGLEAVGPERTLFACAEIRRNCALYKEQPPQGATSGTCHIYAFMQEVEQKLKEALASKTIADLLCELSCKTPKSFSEQRRSRRSLSRGVPKPETALIRPRPHHGSDRSFRILPEAAATGGRWIFYPCANGRVWGWFHGSVACLVHEPTD